MGSPQLRFLFLVLLQIGTVAMLALILWAPSSNDRNESGLSADHWRQTAAKLHAAGVATEAARYYERYLTSSHSDAKTRASIAFSLGELYEQEGDWSRALGWFHQVELFDRQSEHRAAAGKKIVALLEKGGRLGAARRALAQQTGLRDQQEEVEGAVEVARIGERKVFLHQVNEAMDALPESMRSSVKSKEGREQFLRKYVADELLYQKAQRLDLASDPKFAKQVEAIRRQLLVQTVIEREVGNKLKVDPADVKNFFEANKKRYQKDKKGVTFADVKEQVTLDYRLEKMQSLYQQLIEETLKSERVKLFAQRLN